VSFIVAMYSQISFYVISLVAPVLADEDDSVAMGGETVAGEVDVVADALRAIAVVAHTV